MYKCSCWAFFWVIACSQLLGLKFKLSFVSKLGISELRKEDEHVTFSFCSWNLLQSNHWFMLAARPCHYPEGFSVLYVRWVALVTPGFYAQHPLFPTVRDVSSFVEVCLMILTLRLIYIYIYIFKFIYSIFLQFVIQPWMAMLWGIAYILRNLLALWRYTLRSYYPSNFEFFQ